MKAQPHISCPQRAMKFPSFHESNWERLLSDAHFTLTNSCHRNKSGPNTALSLLWHSAAALNVTWKGAEYNTPFSAHVNLEQHHFLGWYASHSIYNLFLSILIAAICWVSERVHVSLKKLQPEQQCECQTDIIDLLLKFPPEILGILNYLGYSFTEWICCSNLESTNISVLQEIQQDNFN